MKSAENYDALKKIVSSLKLITLTMGYFCLVSCSVPHKEISRTPVSEKTIWQNLKESLRHQKNKKLPKSVVMKRVLESYSRQDQEYYFSTVGFTTNYVRFLLSEGAHNDKAIRELFSKVDVWKQSFAEEDFPKEKFQSLGDSFTMYTAEQIRHLISLGLDLSWVSEARKAVLKERWRGKPEVYAEFFSHFDRVAVEKSQGHREESENRSSNITLSSEDSCKENPKDGFFQDCKRTFCNKYEEGVSFCQNIYDFLSEELSVYNEKPARTLHEKELNYGSCHVQLKMAKQGMVVDFPEDQNSRWSSSGALVVRQMSKKEEFLSVFNFSKSFCRDVILEKKTGNSIQLFSYDFSKFDDDFILK